MKAERELLGLVLSWELGKTAASAFNSVDRCISGVEWYCDQVGPMLEGRTPVGLVSNIASWNYPLSVLVHACAVQALCGNSVIAKTPTDGGSLSITLSVALARREGIPISLISGSGGQLSEALVRGEHVGAFSFVGGKSTGRDIARRLVDKNKPYMLEMEGVNALGVWNFSDWAKLAGQLKKGFEYGKQRCTAYVRFVVQRDLLPKFLETHMGVLKGLKIGNPLVSVDGGKTLRGDLDFGPLINEKKVEGISEIRDETDRESTAQKKVRVVIELKRDAMPQIILNKLYKMTQMQVSFGVINLAIVNGQPKVLSLTDTLSEFITFRREVVRNRTIYDLKKARARAHILEGLIKAIDIIDEIIKLIRRSRSTDEAKEGLVRQYKFSEIQAQAILDMQLRRLAALERQKIIDEYAEVIKLIAELEEILANDRVLRNVIIRELRAVQKDYTDERRTQIVDSGVELTLEDLIADEDVVVTLTHSGYVKRTPTSVYRAQKRGGTGRKGMSTRTEDVVSHIFTASTHSYLMAFTSTGMVYKLKVHEIPDATAAGRGKAIVNLINLPSNEKIAAIIPIRDFTAGQFAVMVTRLGIIKKTELSEFANIRSNGIIAIGVDQGDELISVEMTDGQKKIFLATKEGMAICFSEEEVRDMGRQARGVRGITLQDNDYVVSVVAVKGNEQMLTVTSLGYGKQTRLAEYRIQSRGGKGVINMKTTEKNGNVVAVMPVGRESQLMIITSLGKLIRLEADDIRATGRSTQG
ncbi:MAG: aldehyde dehydrogenase family protein, partial [Acidobacteria bacterium]|nr:aldehyde dehydrogenase family protein [Acidobacteriota bacterium]